MFVLLNNNHRILRITEKNEYPDDAMYVEYDIPEDFDYLNMNEYIIVDGELIYSESDEARAKRERAEANAIRDEFINNGPETISALMEENETLLQCILEMSEIVYA